MIVETGFAAPPTLGGLFGRCAADADIAYRVYDQRSDVVWDSGVAVIVHKRYYSTWVGDLFSDGEDEEYQIAPDDPLLRAVRGFVQDHLSYSW